jgi:hypothetical protein
MYSQKPQTPSNETKIKLVTQYQDIDNVEKLWIAGI